MLLSNNKNLLQHFFKIVVFFVFLFIINYFFNFIFISQDSDKYTSEKFREYCTKENIDTIFLGTSVGYMINSNIIDEKLGYNSVNLSTPNQYFGTTLDYLELVSKQQPLERVIISMGYTSLTKKDDYRSKSAFNNALYASQPLHKQLLNKISVNTKMMLSSDLRSKSSSINVWFPWIECGQRSFSSIKTNIIEKIDAIKSGTYITKATYSLDPHYYRFVRQKPYYKPFKYNTKSYNFNSFEVSPEALQSLDYIIEYCKTNDIQLIILHTIHRSDYSESYGDDYNKIDSFCRDYFDSKDITYINMDTDSALRESIKDNYFNDQEHLADNIINTIATPAIAEYLKNL